MNNERRKELAVAAALIERAYEILDDVYGQEEEAMENMPESLQYNSERWDTAEEGLTVIDTARSEAESAKMSIEEHFDLPSVSQDMLIKRIRGL